MSLNVIFDMDGVLFNSEHLFTCAWKFAGEKIGLKNSDELAQKTIGESFENSKKIWKSAVDNQKDFDSVCNYFISYINDHYKSSAPTVKKGVYEILDFLKNKNAKIALASNARKSFIDSNLNYAKITEYFQEIISVEMVENPKPAPDIYLKACSLLGVNPQDSYAIEDSKSGVMAASTAGCKTILVPDMNPPERDTIEHAFAMYKDLLQVKSAFESEELK